MKKRGRYTGRFLGLMLAAAAMLSVCPLLRASNTPCAIAPGTWCEISNTRMSDVFPSPDKHPGWGILGPRGVTAAWGGGALDSKRNKLVVTGGGHADYGGNEVYEFDVASLKWKRATEPSPMREVKDGEYAVESGQAPVSSHTYGGLAFLPSIDRVFKFGGSYYGSGNSYDQHAYLYNVEARTWSRQAASPRRVLTPVADYDVKTGRVLVVAGGGLLSYDPVSDSWEAQRTKDGHEVVNAGAIDHGTRRFVVISRHGEMTFYELDNIGPRKKAPLKGKADWGHRVGLAYHPPTSQLVLWEGGREVWTVDARTWEVCKIANRTGKAPIALKSNGQPKTQGIYGRWRYIPQLDLFIGYNDSNDNVWFYKLARHSEGARSSFDQALCG